MNRGEFGTVGWEGAKRIALDVERLVKKTPLDDHSVTQWLPLLMAGNKSAAQPLWERYHQRMMGFARQRLGKSPRRMADEEDIVVSAFQSFCRSAEEGRFPRLENRDDLWQLLIMIAARKASDQWQRERRKKRGGGTVRGESAFRDQQENGRAGLDGFPAPEPTPEWSAQLAEEHSRLLLALGNEELQRIAVWKMEGDSNEEIAGRLGCAVRTVERKLVRIRSVWKEAFDRIS